MAAVSMQTLVLSATVLLLSLSVRVDFVKADPECATITTFGPAMATFYGGTDGSGTYGGSCGYGNPWATGYGMQTAALSTPMFNNGLTCGACFELQCNLEGSSNSKQWCYPNAQPITITATNLCPPGSYGGWCDPPKVHFDLAYAAFTKLANEVGGVIAVQYKRVQCNRQGGIIFSLTGNPYWNSVLVTNVAGAGNVVQMSIRGNNGIFSPMAQSWGQNFNCFEELTGQGLTFRITTGLGHSATFWNVFPSNWWFGMTSQTQWNLW